MVEDIVEQAEAVLKKLDCIGEVILVKNRSKSSLYERGLRVEESASIGIGIRAILDNRVGFSYGTDLKKVDGIIERAKQTSKFGNKFWGFGRGKKFQQVKGLYSKKTADLEPRGLVEIVKDSLNQVKTEVVMAGASTEEGEWVIMNTEGLKVSEKSTMFDFGMSSKTQTSIGFGEVRSHDVQKIGRAIEEADFLATETQNPKPVKGEFDVLFRPHALSGELGLLEIALSSALRADNVLNKRSVWGGKIGKTVASDLINLMDWGNMPGALGSSKSDGEGTPTKKTQLVRDGVLLGFINDIETAKRMTVKPTGNGNRTFSSLSNPSPSNLVLKPGKKDAMADFTGIEVWHLSGTHTLNSYSGEFSVEIIHGFYCENGERKYPVRAMLAGNAFKMLKRVTNVGNDPRQFGSLITPSLRISGLSITG